jgi:site-specific DNA-cytosine methylase
MENVITAPLPEIEGYQVDPTILDNRWLGNEQRRKHRFSFGTHDGRTLKYREVIFEHMKIAPRVLANGSVMLRLDAKGDPRKRLRKTTSRSWAELGRSLRLQGLPEDYFGELPYRVEAAHSLIGNAVALPMARELARAVREAIDAYDKGS